LLTQGFHFRRVALFIPDDGDAARAQLQRQKIRLLGLLPLIQQSIDHGAGLLSYILRFPH